MANPPIGVNVWEGVLGVVDIYFNNVYLGKTTADTELAIDEDLKDVIFQQDGTKYYDKVRTGIAWMLNCTFGQIDTDLAVTLLQGWVKSTTGNSVKIGRSLYQSMRNNEALPLEIRRVDSEGNPSTDPRHRIKFWLAAPQVTGNFQWGADTQRNLAVTFFIFFNENEEAFGYSGYATSVSVTA